MRTVKQALSLALLAVVSLTSCDKVIYDYDDNCREGLELRFVYEYNMESANAFHQKVDCLTVLFYDAAGNLVQKRTEHVEALRNPEYRMVVDLPEGHYHVAAYGGMECEDASFVFDSDPASISKEERTVSLATTFRSEGDNGLSSSAMLHDHYFGSLDIDVAGPSMEYTTATVEMMRNTNHFRIILQQINGKPLKAADFVMSITDDNIRFAHDNSLIPSGEVVTYRPWAASQSSVGTNAEGTDWDVAHFDLSTSRLISRDTRSAATPAGSSSVDSPRLVVNRASDGKKIIDIPLINYLMLFKSDRYSHMDAQEFLDRTGDWNMVFFLDESTLWLRTQIVVNGWTVRINDTSL